MQRATLVIVVMSEDEKFDVDSNDIQQKALAKLLAGKYTVDIHDLNPAQQEQALAEIEEVE